MYAQELTLIECQCKQKNGRKCREIARFRVIRGDQPTIWCCLKHLPEGIKVEKVKKELVSEAEYTAPMLPPSLKEMPLVEESILRDKERAKELKKQKRAEQKKSMDHGATVAAVMSLNDLLKELNPKKNQNPASKVKTKRGLTREEWLSQMNSEEYHKSVFAPAPDRTQEIIKTETHRTYRVVPVISGKCVDRLSAEITEADDPVVALEFAMRNFPAALVSWKDSGCKYQIIHTRQ